MACAESPFHGAKTHNTDYLEGAKSLEVRIWRSDAQEPIVRRVAGALLLGRDLLGQHATRDPSEAPILTLIGSHVQVEVRKEHRFVWGVAGRRFDDLPGHPGSLGRYWTWVSHPERDELLFLLRKRPPHNASYLEGYLRLYRLRLRPLRGERGAPLQIQGPCIIVAGLGAVEVAGSGGSTGMSQPEPLARLDLDELRRHLQSLSPRTTKLTLPCVMPGAQHWTTSEPEAVARLTSLLDNAFKRADPPPGLLLPCYLPDSTPGLILARRDGDGWSFTSSDAALERWIERGCKPAQSAQRATAPGPAGERAAPFVYEDYSVFFENEGLLQVARRIVLEGKDYRPGVARAATRGAWRRAACIYALWLRECAVRDLRQCGWSNGMARCVEDFVDELGGDSRAWLRKEDGPRTFAEKFTVKKSGSPAEDATEALAALLDALVRPHGRTKTGTGSGRRLSPSFPPSAT